MSRCLTQEPKFLVLNKKAAWDRGLPINLDVSEDGLQIRETFEYVFARENDIEVLSDKFKVQDFAVGECSQLFILDEQSPAIWIYDTDQKQIDKIDCIGKVFRDPTSICHAAGTLYVADREADARISALAELNWQIRFTVGAFPRSDSLSLPQPFKPIDLAIDSEGNLFALDESNLAILRFDDTARLVDVFGQAELQGTQPASIALSGDGALYVLTDQKVLKFPTHGTGTAKPNFIDFTALIASGVLPPEFRPSGFGIDQEGVLYVGDNGDGGLSGNQEDSRFIRRFDPAGKYLGVVADFRGAVDELVIDEDNSIFIFRAEETNTITALRRENRFALLEGASLVKGRYISLALDSTEAGTTWHKLISTTTLPANTQIQISFLAADDREINIGGDQRDLDNFLADTARLDPAADGGREAKEKRLVDLDQLAWSRPVVNSDDALIAAEGRYLWVRIDLIGSELESPSIHSLQVHYPRTSYLRYLPAVYQEDERSRDFLERFLSLFETFFAGIESQVDHLQRYFDPDSTQASGDFLPWLSTWLAISADNNWDDVKLRTLVKRAAEIYKNRGTRAAIQEMIEILIGDRPLIVEHFQTSCAAWRNQKPGPDLDEIKKIYERLYGQDPFCFCVLLKPFPVKTEEQRQAVRRIIDSEKPAHTCAGLLALQPWIQLDTHTYLEINTYLSQPSARLDFGSAIPRDTVLDDFLESGQLERRSRIDLDIKLT